MRTAGSSRWCWRSALDFLPPDALEELRMAGLELLDEPEMVETRAYSSVAPDETKETEDT